MFRWINGSVIRGIAALIALVVVTWLALEYFVPSLPTRITIGAGGKGTTFEYFADHYRKRFARAGVNLIVRETAGALENLELLKDPNSGIQIGFVTGGLSNGEDVPNASRIRAAIVSGCEIKERWLAFTSIVLAPIRFAINRSRSGLIVRSSVETA